ncbi:neprilysin-1-like [Ornithodoros turicata]|uniref:neprilysin-1-like n=1 Tax=Ornithodoros turicata TaxID=34597 RepID=UPI003139941C
METPDRVEIPQLQDLGTTTQDINTAPLSNIAVQVLSISAVLLSLMTILIFFNMFRDETAQRPEDPEPNTARGAPQRSSVPPSTKETTPSSGSEETTTTTSTPKPRDEYVCETKDCFDGADIYNRSVTQSNDPCKNFYAYVCGNGVNTMHELHQQLSSEIRKAFLASAVSEDSAVKKARDFRQSCSTRENNKDDNLQTLKVFFEETGLSFTGGTGIDPLSTVVRLLLSYGMPVFIDIVVDQRELYEETYLLSLVEDERFRLASQTDVSDEDMQVFVENVISELGVADPQEIAREIFKSQQKVINFRRSNGYDTAQPATAQLAAFFQDGVLNDKWNGALRQYSEGVLPGSYFVNFQESFRDFLTETFSTVSDSDLESVIAWSLASRLSIVAGLNSDTIDSRKLNCYDKTREMFQYAVTSPYLHATVNQSRLLVISKMIKQIQSTIIGNMRKSQWLDGFTREALVSKVEDMKFQVGFPKGLETAAGVNRFYLSYPQMGGTFLKSFLDASKAQIRAMLRFIGKVPADILALDVSREGVDALYNRENVVRISAGMLVSPILSYGGHAGTNYGALGSVIAGQIMRGFVGSARHEAKPNVHITWSSNSEREFQDRMQCFQNAVPEGSTAEQEDLKAYMMPLTSHYQAFRSALVKGRVPTALKRFTDDQLFFIAGCFLHCGDTGNTVPASRCNVPLRQSSAFSAAFKCKDGSLMNPRDKCTLW